LPQAIGEVLDARHARPHGTGLAIGDGDTFSPRLGLITTVPGGASINGRAAVDRNELEIRGRIGNDVRRQFVNDEGSSIRFRRSAIPSMLIRSNRVIREARLCEFARYRAMRHAHSASIAARPDPTIGKLPISATEVELHFSALNPAICLSIG
jgi:hypothetical protein